jgi:hypothetical protein
MSQSGRFSKDGQSRMIKEISDLSCVMWGFRD